MYSRKCSVVGEIQKPMYSYVQDILCAGKRQGRDIIIKDILPEVSSRTCKFKDECNAVVGSWRMDIFLRESGTRFQHRLKVVWLDRPSVRDSAILKSKRTVPKGIHGLFLTCGLTQKMVSYSRTCYITKLFLYQSEIIDLYILERLRHHLHSCG